MARARNVIADTSVISHTHTHRRCLQLLKQDQPGWILLGCQAHALALLLKDLGDATKGKIKWFSKVYDIALMMTAVINGSDKVCTCR